VTVSFSRITLLHGASENWYLTLRAFLEKGAEETIWIQQARTNEQLHNLYSSTNIIRLIKLKGDGMDKTCSTMVELRIRKKIESKILRGRLGGCGVDVRIILKYIIKNRM
jgi:hypothetical protein